MNNSDKIILDLCGGTGSWSKPYKEAGYDVKIVTLPDHDVRTYVPPDNVYGILAAPPCTEFSPALETRLMSNEGDQRNFVSALEIVSACCRIILTCNPIYPQFWAIENPAGHLQKWLGPPRETFQPWWYGDPWTKKTSLWGNFSGTNIEYDYWSDVPKNEKLYIRPGREKPSFAFLHKSAIKDISQLSEYNPKTDAEFRAITPPGFAKAFFWTNQ